MAIPVNDLRKGVVFQHNGEIHQVLEYKHKSIARGKADIKIKSKNLENGATVEVSFKSGQNVEDVECYWKELDFVFFNERKNELVFSDPENKRRVIVEGSVLAESQRQFLAGGSAVRVMKMVGEDRILSVEMPITVELSVKQAPPSDRGDTASGGGKPVVLETGAVVQAPMFIQAGDVIKVNTETGSYMERINR